MSIFVTVFAKAYYFTYPSGKDKCSFKYSKIHYLRNAVGFNVLNHKWKNIYIYCASIQEVSTGN